MCPTVCHKVGPQIYQNWLNKISQKKIGDNFSKSHVSNLFFLWQGAGWVDDEDQKTE